LRRHVVGALEEVRDLAAAVTRRRELRLWDVELVGHGGRAVVRVFVDSDDGVDLDTVANVSEEISRGLDLRDPLPGRYTLEVSSPGLERNLRTPEHFELSVGRKVVLKTRQPVVGTTNRFDGVIVEAGERGVSVSVDKGGEDIVTVPYEVIRSARTVFEWS
jgi:ribosome maturation factor RimP